ncbi:MAG: oligopeptide transporter OPT family protein [Calditrichaeota bacterium]|nr:MAG: oligopeptide transporter OPT family protein [Calditrichota bacterium]MBL1205530.1 oligopeptide transporter OPT family protein [Calditrichota bacterium]NOG45359.1 oligopeptide transporter OPT family protein [Calditrichota bacterium]
MSATAEKVVVRRGAYPELTPTALFVGYGLGILIALSIGYASLILGFSIEGSELAAILGFGILRGIMGRSSIVENNINQTIASAVNGASSGMMFSVPALFILGQTDFNAVIMVFATIAGGILGIAFIIPLRKQMIDFERLTYPGGVAVATILKSPGAGIKKAYYLLGGAAISAVVHFFSQYIGVEDFHLGEMIGMPDYMNGVWYISLLTFGAAYIAGKGGIFFIVGGFVSYWILAPIMASTGIIPTPEVLTAAGQDMPDYLRLQLFRPVGIGMLIGGALMGIVLALPLILSAIKSMQQSGKLKTGASQDEMPIKLLYMAVAGAAILLFVIALYSTAEMGWFRGLLMAVLGTLWIWVAGVILSECIGRTNWSPLSGMTLIAVTILIIIASGLSDSAAIISSLLVGAAACVAMSQATDLMMDLKTGYLVGATPKKQQIAQFSAAWLGPIVIMALIFVLHEAYGLGSERLPAPQGQALASMIEGILGGDVPVQKYIAGAGLGAMLSATGVGGLGVLVGLGFYLPFNIVLTYSLGTLARFITDWKMGKEWSEQMGIPAAAGLIVGEALVGVGFAIYFIIQGMGA